jgi:membrane-associated protease RseP (regulator of RpoE activity)
LRPILVCKDGSCDEFREIGILPRQELIVRSIQDKDSNVKIGDQILRANGKDIMHIRSLREMASNRRMIRLEVLRDGRNVTARAYTKPVIVEKPYAVLHFKGITVDVIPFYPDGTNKNQVSENTDSRLKLFSTQDEDLNKYKLFSGAEIVKINGVDCRNLYDIASLMNRQHDNVLTVLKPGAKRKTDVEPKDVIDAAIPAVQIQVAPPTSTNILGIGFGTSTVILHKHPFEQISEMISTTLRTLGCLFNKNSDVSVKNLMGPTGIVRTLHMFAKTDVRLLLWCLILININLAIVNILPLPVLDGGHVAMALVEKITGKEHVAKIFGVLQGVFLLILLGLLAYVSFFDIRRLVIDREYSRKELLRM